MTLIARLLVFSCLLLVPASTSAHGIQGHIHVTGWAIENLPAGELRDFFGDPEVMDAALFGAAFTDSGYWPLAPEMTPIARAYAEHNHWEPFVRDAVAWIRAHDPPPWSNVESRKRVAFFMGCASHGLQDEVFDSLFLYHVDTHDHGGQDEADPGTDGFLLLDGHQRFQPSTYMPMDALLTLYEGLEPEVTQGVIEAAVDKMMDVYVNDEFGRDLALAIGEASIEIIPWTYDHYMDPEIPGSLRSEIRPTLGYLESLWERVHGRFDPDTVVVATFPDDARRLLGIAAESPDSWVTMIYGAGVKRDGAAHLWRDAGGGPVAFQRHGTRWNAEWTRLHTLRPTGDLPDGTWMTATLPAGSDLIDGTTTTLAHDHAFQTPCLDPEDVRCEPLDPIVDPVTTGWVALPEPEIVDDPVDPVPDETDVSGGCHGGPDSSLPLWLSLFAWAWANVPRGRPCPELPGATRHR